MASPLINFIVLVLSLLLAVFGAAQAYGHQLPLLNVTMLFLGGYGLGLTLPTFLTRLRGAPRKPKKASASAERPRRAERRQRQQRKERAPRSERRQRSKSSKPRKRAPRHVGTVKWFDESKGYGFITPEDGGKDCFVHRSVLPNGGSLAEGKRVEFEVIIDDRGREAAANVVLL